MKELQEGSTRFHKICDRESGDQFGRRCLLYTSDAADEEDSVDLGGRRIINKKIKLEIGLKV